MARRRAGSRAPEVLRRAYGDRALPLGKVVLALLPQPPPYPAECRCRGRRCLGCGGAQHLIRDGDPPDYRLLLSRAFCVLYPNPPPPPVVFLTSGLRQKLVVRNTIESMMSSEMLANVLCASYDKESSLSSSFEFLCTHAWDLLLTRIGDPLMVFLLRFSSIFVPLSYKSHHQVTGPTLCHFLRRPNVFCNASVYQNQQLLWMGDHVLSGNRSKRRRDVVEGMPIKDALCCVSTNMHVVGNVVDANVHNVTAKKARKSAKQCEILGRSDGVVQLGLQDTNAGTGSGTDNHGKIEEFQVKSNKNLFSNCGEHTRSQSSDVTSQTSVQEDDDEFLCDHKDNRQGHDLAEMGGSLLSSYSWVMDLAQVLPCAKNKSSAFESCGTDNSRRFSSCAFNCNSGKRARIYSWQRRRRFKNVNSLKENEVNKCKSVVSDGEGSRVELLKTVKINSSHQLVNLARVVSSGIMCGSEIASVHTDEVCLERVAAPFIRKFKFRVAKAASDNKRGKNPHAGSGSVGGPSKYLKGILHSRSLGSNRKFNDLHDRLAPDKVSLQEYGCRMKQQGIESHSEKVGSPCLYCLMLQAPREVSMRTQIKRRHIFYSGFSTCFGFPRNRFLDILNRLKPNDSGAISLMKHIFGFPDTLLNTRLPCIYCSGFSTIKSKCTYHSVLSLLKSLIRNAQRCQYRSLLCRHCPIPTFGHCSQDDGQSSSENTSGDMHCVKSYGISDGKEHKEPLDVETYKVFGEQFDLIESCSRHRQVVSFIWAVTRSIVPLDLLGDFSSWRALRKNIAKFVGLRRFENFCLMQCVHGLKTSCYPIISKIRIFAGSFEYTMKHEYGSCKNMPKAHPKPGHIKMIVCEKFFQNWIYWFFNNIVVPLIRNNFYVTERESKKQNIYYYLKPVWKKLVDGTITCLKEENYRLIDPASLRDIISQRSFGFSKVRFLPKEKTVRLLANLKAQSKVWFSTHRLALRSYLAARENNAWMQHRLMNASRKRKLVYYKSVNSALHELNVVLKRIKVEDPDKLGCSVFDYDDVYRKLYRFICEVKNGSFAIPQVFIVVTDVHKAFDSIDQGILISIMKDLIEDGEYLVRKYSKIVCTKKSIRTLYDHVCFHQSSKIHSIIKYEASICLSPSKSVLIDQGLIRRITQEKLHHLLSEHLKHNILQLGQNFYLQKVGISQGSLLSSLLCSFYYGHLERNVILPYLDKICEKSQEKVTNNELIDRCNLLIVDCSVEQADNGICSLQLGKNYVEVEDLGGNNISKETGLTSDERKMLVIENEASSSTCHFENENSSLPHYLLLRLIDDFLFISTSKDQATSFFNRMRRGFREYNCFMNAEKYGLNFTVDNSRCLPNRVYAGSDRVPFIPWSGLLVNCLTLEIQADYTRYWGIHLNSTITVVNARPGYHLKEKLCDYMRPKCHPIFYDSTINSPAVVRLNAYQAFLLCAMKFHCYICNMPRITNLCPKFLLDVIQRSFSYMYQLIKKRMHNMELSSNIRPVLELDREEVIWLGMSAYIRVLRKKQSRHKELLLLLKSKIMAFESMDGASSYLRYAVDDSHSSMFWEIKY